LSTRRTAYTSFVACREGTFQPRHTVRNATVSGHARRWTVVRNLCRTLASPSRAGKCISVSCSSRFGVSWTRTAPCPSENPRAPPLSTWRLRRCGARRDHRFCWLDRGVTGLQYVRGRSTPRTSSRREHTLTL